MIEPKNVKIPEKALEKKSISGYAGIHLREGVCEYGNIDHRWKF
jgi:hypothetical protein